MAQALEMNNSQITENGYIRNLTDDYIEYRSLKLYECQPEGMETQELNIDDKTYFVANPLIFKERISDAEKEMITRLISQKPVTIPSDSLLFKV